MIVSNSLNSQYVQFVTPIINFKTVQETTLFTPKVDLIINGLVELCFTSVASNNDAVWGLGSIGPNYDDLINLGAAFFVNTAGVYACPAITGGFLIPANTPFKINITSGETGTALTGKFYFNCFYAT